MIHLLIKSFLKDIQKYHNAGISIHEENYYFTVDDNTALRKMLKEKVITKSFTIH